jgi:hypothetical protein
MLLSHFRRVLLSGGACVVSAIPALAACNNFNPATGQTVVCDTQAPNPVHDHFGTPTPVQDRAFALLGLTPSANL